jgi:hypothetical protein
MHRKKEWYCNILFLPGGKGLIQIYFVSRKDSLYSFIIWGTAAFVFLITLYRFIKDGFEGFHLIADLLALIVIGLLLWIWFGTGYQFENETIKIQSGPFKRKINIQEIRKISKGKSALSSPALALDRLIIHYGRYGQVQISPENEFEFIEVLLKKNPNITLDKKLSK